MFLRQLDLEEFRLYRRLSLTLPPEGIGVIGDNASGKSTLVEAVAMLATMRSPRTSSDREVIRWESGTELGFPPYTRMSGTVMADGDEMLIDIALQAESEIAGPFKKQIKIGGRPTRAIDAVGVLKIVLFAPDDVALASGSPSGRRRYLDLTMSQMDRSGVRALARYNRVLEQRNSLLRRLGREGVAASSAEAVSQLAFWDEELVRFGARLVAWRVWVIRRLSKLAAERYRVFGAGSVLSLVYVPSVAEAMQAANGADDVETLRAKIAPRFADQLAATRRDELRRGVTLSGPHRDDFRLLVDGREVGVYGSRGQQRLAVVALKLAEADVIGGETGETPVTLLDDVLSELDTTNRSLLLAALGESGTQLVVTAADPHLLDSAELARLPTIRVSEGTII